MRTESMLLYCAQANTFHMIDEKGIAFVVEGVVEDKGEYLWTCQNKTYCCKPYRLVKMFWADIRDVVLDRQVVREVNEEHVRMLEWARINLRADGLSTYKQ